MKANEAAKVSHLSSTQQKFSRPKSSVQLGGGARAYPRQRVGKDPKRNTDPKHAGSLCGKSDSACLLRPNKHLARPYSNLNLKATCSTTGASAKCDSQNFESTNGGSSIKKVPEGVIDWYMTNIINSVDCEPRFEAAAPHRRPQTSLQTVNVYEDNAF